MRRSVSADSVNQCTHYNLNIQNKSKKLLPALIKQSRCKTFNKYKACALVSGTVLTSCCNSTDVVTPSANIGNSTTNNTINTDTISNNTQNIMNDDNRKVMQIAEEKGIDEAVKHMFNPTGEKQLSYAEMRERYG